MYQVTGVTTTTCSVYCLIPPFSAVVHSPASTLNLRTNELNILSINPRTRGPSFFLGENCLKLSTFCGVQSKNWASSMDTQRQGVWEDPDDGGDSDYEYDDEDEDGDGESEEKDLDYESDWENQERNAAVTMAAATATTNSTTYKFASASYEKDLVEEIEQLLSPEEKEILAQNKTSNLSKISTAKWKPLQTLALSGQIHFMDKMLENGVDVDSVDKDGRTALHSAVIGKKEPVISHLLRKGANPHITDQGGASALHYAVQVGAMQTVKLLVKYNVDVNVADIDGWTPLHVAVQSRNRDIAKILLVNGADKTRKNRDGMTPLDLSLCYGKDFKSYDIAKLLKVVPANRDL